MITRIKQPTPISPARCRCHPQRLWLCRSLPAAVSVALSFRPASSLSIAPRGLLLQPPASGYRYFSLTLFGN
ncbi:hypothetical protein L2E82_16694 [Cichorium intybus]|uniref:Uncharacterized protein n=1 Tax=Cichorium intybus TaxID=13427 RepID=A0ACB9F680_CICIN|nr:hypothetical protein L2E82_16694 [Cichorium intybus]